MTSTLKAKLYIIRKVLGLMKHLTQKPNLKKQLEMTCSKYYLRLSIACYNTLNYLFWMFLKVQTNRKSSFCFYWWKCHHQTLCDKQEMCSPEGPAVCWTKPFGGDSLWCADNKASSRCHVLLTLRSWAGEGCLLRRRHGYVWRAGKARRGLAMCGNRSHRGWAAHTTSTLIQPDPRHQWRTLANRKLNRNIISYLNILR